jgi:hypothetical protein
MSADSDLRVRVGSIPPGISFPPVELLRAPQLAEATIAIVTTAALAHPGEPWADQTHDYRLFDRDDDHLLLAHNSTNFDRSGFTVDRNVVYPIDRLREMESEGVIGRVARASESWYYRKTRMGELVRRYLDTVKNADPPFPGAYYLVPLSQTDEPLF